MQVNERRTCGRLCVTIRHADHAGFLQAEHVVDVFRPVAEKSELRRARIAEHTVDAEGAKHTERRFPNRQDFRVHWQISLGASLSGAIRTDSAAAASRW